MFLQDILSICVMMLFIPSLYNIVDSTLVVKPENVAAVSRHFVTLHCASNISKGNIAWNTINPRSSRRNIIYNDYVLATSVVSYISVSDTDDGHCSLNITASLTAAKRYICVERDSGEEASAELSVLESNAMCDSTVISKNAVDVNCSITSAGNWVPLATCREYFENGENAFKGNVLQDNQVKRSEDHLANSVWNFNGMKTPLLIYCLTKFEASERPKETSATNIPDGNIWIQTYQPQATDDGIVRVVIITVVVTIIVILLVEIPVVLLFCRRRKGKSSRSI